MSITKTRTGTIMSRGIWNLKNSTPILVSILKSGIKKIRNGLKGLGKRVLPQPQNGINHPKGLNGIGSMRSAPDLGRSFFRKEAARHAAVFSNRLMDTKNFAPTNARVSIGGMSDLITNQEIASIVKNSSRQTNTRKDSIVQQAVVLSIAGSYAGIENVYDLEVGRKHEYFANGVLVHNCDALRYAVFTHLTQPITEWGGVDEKGNRF